MSLSLAGKVAVNIQNSPTTFRVQKKAVPAIMLALTGGQPNPFTPSVRGLIDFPMAGKFARRVGKTRRAVHLAMVAIQEERTAIEACYSEEAPAAHTAILAMFEESIEITCHGFTTEELEGLADVAPRVVDALLDLEIGGETNVSDDEAAAGE